MRIFSTLVYLFVGYVVGLWLAAPGLFSATLTLTAWSNIWTWVWILFWPFLLLWHFLVWAIVICVGIFFMLLVLNKLGIL